MKSTFFPIIYNNKTIAIIIRSNHHVDNLQFFTKDKDPLQVGIHNKKAHMSVLPHFHKTNPQVIKNVYEVFYIVKGVLKLTMYSKKTGRKIKSVILLKGDAAIHMGEGHGIEFIEDTVLFEVKQGPFLGVQASKTYIKFN